MTTLWNSLRLLSPVVLLAGGLGLSSILSDRFETDARDHWEKQAGRSAQWLTDTYLGWLGESFHPLSGIAARIESSGILSENEFFRIFDALESRAVVSFIEGVAVARPIEAGANAERWHLILSSETDGPLAELTTVGSRTVLLEALQAALSRRGRITLGPPHKGDRGYPISAVALVVESGDGPVAVLGLIDYRAIADAIFEVHSPTGAQLAIDGRFPVVHGRSQSLPVLMASEADFDYAYASKTISGEAELLLQWQFTPEFAGGPGTATARVALWGGSLISVLVALLMLDLIFRNREINRRVVEATEEANLQAGRARAASRAKSEFLAKMSHELRTPMHAILGLSHLMLKTDLSQKQQDYLDKISDSAQNLLGIINDVLDISKIEAGKLEIETIDFNLEQILADTCNLVSVQAEKEGIELLLNVDPAVPLQLHGDPLRLKQVLTNLTSNAVKFTDSGEIEIQVKVSERAGDRIVLRFRVRDTGVGIAETDQDRLFQIFTQADESTTRQFGGTGLGLSISRQLVELMQGRIWVESEPGQGSKFYFTATFGLGTSATAARSGELPELLKQLRILIVDDNATSRSILTGYVQSLGYGTEQASSGEQSIQILRSAESPFQLVLMDWKMPGMDGVEAARQIEADPGIRKTPKILMISAYNRDEMMQRASATKIDAFLVKPISPSTLQDAILNCFRVESAEPPPAPSTAKRFSGVHLLLVEDNDINQQIVLELLEPEGFDVEVANNGLEALDRLRSSTRPFDVVLMDIQMPEMDGYTAIRHIRRDDRLKDLPVIAMTANAFESDQKAAIAAGMNDHLSKPIDFDHLIQVLSGCLNPERK